MTYSVMMPIWSNVQSTKKKNNSRDNTYDLDKTDHPFEKHESSQREF